MQAALELQAALQARLAADPALTAFLGGPKIHDHAPDGAQFPYVTWGAVSAVDWSTASEEGSEILAALHVWTRARGKKEVFAICSAISAAIESAPVSLAQGHLVLLRVEEEEARYGPAGVHHGIIRLRALIENPA